MLKEREISIVEIIIEILKKWKLVLILAVVFAILLGGYRFIGLNGTEIAPPAADDTKLTFEDYQRQVTYNTDRLGYYTAMYEKAGEYLANSYLMSIDPYNCAIASRTCIFHGDKVYTEAAAAAMLNTIQNIDCAALNIADGTELEKLDGQYIDELISITTPIDEVDVETPRFTVTVIAADKATAEKLLNNLISAAEKENRLSLDFLNTAPGLGWEYSPAASKTEYNAALRKSQTDASNDLRGYEDQIIKYKDALKALDKDYGEMYGEDYVEPDAETTPVKISLSSALKSAVKYAAIGFVLGAIIGMVIAFIKVLSRPSLYYSRQLFCAADIRFIGNIEDTESLKGIAKLCKKLAGDKEFISPLSERVSYTAANIAALAKDKRVLVTGTAAAADVQAAVDALKADNKDLQLICKGNLTLSAAALKALDDADAILIMEQTDASALKPLAALLDSCRFTDKEILGYVMI